MDSNNLIPDQGSEPTLDTKERSPTNNPPDQGFVLQSQHPTPHQQLLPQTIQNHVAPQPNLSLLSTLSQTPSQNNSLFSNTQQPGLNSASNSIGQNSNIPGMFPASQRQMRARQLVFTPQQQQPQNQQILYQQQELPSTLQQQLQHNGKWVCSCSQVLRNEICSKISKHQGPYINSKLFLISKNNYIIPKELFLKHPQPSNLQGSAAAVKQNNAASLQLNSMSGLSTTQQNMSNTIQPSNNVEAGQGNFMNSLQQVPLSSLQQNSVSTPQQTNINSLSSQGSTMLQLSRQPTLSTYQLVSTMLQPQQKHQMLQNQQYKPQHQQLGQLMLRQQILQQQQQIHQLS
ncbi:hypothetical protein RYX36_011415 [Vicia faba]